MRNWYYCRTCSKVVTLGDELLHLKTHFPKGGTLGEVVGLGCLVKNMSVVSCVSDYLTSDLAVLVASYSLELVAGAVYPNPGGTLSAKIMTVDLVCQRPCGYVGTGAPLCGRRDCLRYHSVLKPDAVT